MGINTLKTMLPGIAILVGIVLTSGFAGSGAQAQGLFSEAEQVLYGANATGETSIVFGNWGGGVCKESNTNSYGGGQSIEITPRGFYQGGRLDFATPLDCTKWFGDPDTYLQFVTRFRNVQPTTDPWAVGLGTTAMGMAASTSTGKPVKRMQVMVFFENSRATECQVDVDAYKPGEDGWVDVSLPFATLKGKLNLPAYKIRRIVLTADGSETFYVGEIRVVKDKTPIEADAGEEKETGRNYPVNFTAAAEAGVSALKYSWDFSKIDGIQEEAVGDTITHRFTRAGDFVVTLTVSDVFGLKKPATATVSVIVNE